ncbi:MAG: hypothetical protein GWN29_08725 [Gammaproteobacteria bacterium]|nr:hypothetical protein [Gammaproteobacteria bacterium]
MRRLSQLTASVLLLTAATAGAHHGSAPFDTNSTVTIEGVVTRFDYRNPHGFLYLRSTNAAGDPVDVTVETVGSSLRSHGLGPDSLTAGEEVILVMNPSHRSPEEWGLGVQATKDDGTVVPLSVRFARALEQRSTGTTTSLAGVWVPRGEDFFRFVFARREWPLTDEGARLRDAFDIKDSPQGRCEAIPPPTLMLYGSVDVVEVLDDRVLIHSDWLDAERIIYTDGRSAAPDQARSVNGYSVGRWENGALVVETTHYTDNNSGLAQGMPSGPRKRLDERFELLDDGSGIRYSYTLEDPDYLVEPVSGESIWDYRPDLTPDPVPCDLESAGRYLTE